MKNESLRKEIEKCTTPKQVLKVLDKHNIEIIRDTTDEVGCFSIWIDDTTRIYQQFGHMCWQTWHKVDFSYSGTPTFFSGND